MKNIVRTIFWLFACFIINIANTQELYYYYYNDTVNLFEDKKSVVLIFNEDAYYKNRAERFENDTTIIEMNVSCGDEDLYFARLTFSEIQNDILYKLSEFDIDTSDLEAYGYGYYTENGISFWATNEIIINKLPSYKVAPDSLFLDSILNHYNAIYYESDRFGVDFYKVENPADAINLSAELHENNMVIFAEPVFSTNSAFLSQINDPLFEEQYYLHNTGQIIDGTSGVSGMDIDAVKAWTVSKGSSSIRVAVVDDGVDLDPVHPDMHGSVIEGWTPNCLSNCDGRPKTGHKHGEAIAGIITANHNNVGVRGIAPNVKIVPIRIARTAIITSIPFMDNLKSNKEIAKGINKAWSDLNADVLNFSWVRAEPSVYIDFAIYNAITYGRDGKGSIVVCGAGPTSGPVRYPANLVDEPITTIAVGAINKSGIKTVYSPTGPEIDFVAFGGDGLPGGGYGIRTTDRKKGYSFFYDQTESYYTHRFGGTSAAAPQVASVAALLLSRNPNLTRQEVYCRLAMTATDLGDFGRDDLYGHGLINAYRAIAYDDMVLTDKTFGGLQDFWAANTITSEGTIIEQGADVTLRSGNQIRVTSGRAKAGSTFRAYIDACDPCAGGGTMMLASNNSSYPNQANANFNISESEIEDFEKDENQASETKQLVYAYEFSAFPNPFDNSTTISFNHNQSSKVNIYITNSYGQEVLQLHNKYTVPGNYEIKIDGNRLQPGVYFCVIETDRGRETIKIVKM